MSVTIVTTTAAKSGSITVKPYFDSSVSNMGLEKYGLSLHDGVYHEEQLACIEMNGVKRYLTGLNEFAPEVKLLPEEQRVAKAKEIRKIVAQLERDLAANVLDPEDPQFWNKLTLLKPDNDEFWSRITMRCGNETIYFDPIKDSYDLIKLHAIEAGGFSMIAKSYDDARSRAVPPKFFLDKYLQTATTVTEYKKLRNKGVAQLQKLFDKDTNKLFYIAKVLDTNSIQYKKSTPNDILYDNMDKYIHGEGSESNKKRAAQGFIDAAALDMETLKLRALIKDSTFYKFIATKSDGFIYHIESSAMLGRSPSDALEYLKNPLNEQILNSLMKVVEGYWNA